MSTGDEESMTIALAWSGTTFLIFEAFQDLGTHVGHDAPVDDNIGGGGDFDTNFREWRVNRTHAKGDDIHGASLHAAIKLIMHRVQHFSLVSPVVGWSHLVASTGADIGAIFDTCHVARR